MRGIERLIKVLILLGAFGLSSYFAVQFGSGGLWEGIESAHAVAPRGVSDAKRPYDLTRLEAVTKTIETIRDKYVEPSRVKPKHMLLSALDFVQRDVAEVIVLRNGKSDEVTVRVGSAEKKFQVGDVVGPWDVSAHLREIFTFLQTHLKNKPEVDLRELEYAACNGMLNTLDPHSVFLSPDAYREMSISTQGAFGGVGIVISIRDQMLTIIRPMPGTPAGRAGLKRMDQITGIENESTLNMPLDDAVARLRGDPGTYVTIHIHRGGVGGWPGSRPFKLRREEINVDSVESRMLDEGVGYVLVKQFQSGTVGELDRALATLHRLEPRLRGLVLDLRGNPGGLLDQAAKVADRFLRRGVIVTTVSASEPRDEKKAKAPGTEPAYPLVVLVSSSSASASEIVAGALKNHNRGVIVGQKTFGKGSVQLVFPEITRDKAALKLTIAQYLTPGDVSIQSVGITPDIDLDPMTVDALEMDVMRSGKRVRERDLSKHLRSTRARAGQKPLVQLRYNLPEALREKMRDQGHDPQDKFEVDFPIRFARNLVLHMNPGAPRPDAVQAANEFIQRVQGEEIAKVAADLNRLGLDWSAPSSPTDVPAPEDYEIKVKTNRPNNEAGAGAAMSLEVVVKNKSKHPVHQLRAITESDNAYFDRKELIFGKIEPGKSVTAKTPLGWCDYEGRRVGSTRKPKNAKRVCTIPKDASARQDGITVQFATPVGKPPPPMKIRATTRALPRPSFAYAYQIVDNGPGANGDGRLQRGEHITMYLTVKNIGEGKSFETQANIRNLSGSGLALKDGRFDISNMKPGDVRSVAFTWGVRPTLKEGEVVVELVVGDRNLSEYAKEKIKFPVASPLTITRDEGVSKIAGRDAVLLETYGAARPFGTLPVGSLVQRTGRYKELVKVELGANRFAFLSSSQLADAGGAQAPDAVSFDTIFSHAPPKIELEAAPLASRSPKAQITGTITDPTKMLDAFMFVGSRKIFYQSNQGASDAKSMKIKVDVPLRPGVNVITLFGRHNADTTARRTVVIRRDGPGGELLKTPESDDDELLGFPWSDEVR